MNLFNRSFVACLALAWCAALVLGGYLTWDQGREMSLDGQSVRLNFDLVFETQAEQVLATLALAALALPALLLLAMELMPSGAARTARAPRSRDDGYGDLQIRLDALQKQLNEELGRGQVSTDGRERVPEQAQAGPSQPQDAERPAASDNGERTSTGRGWHLLPRRS